MRGSFLGKRIVELIINSEPGSHINNKVSIIRPVKLCY